MQALVDATRIFSNPSNQVGDAIRIVVIVTGTIMLGLFLRVARQVRNTRQFGMYALVCFGVSAIGTEIEQLGEVVTYRLVCNTAGVVLGVVFLWKAAHYPDKLTVMSPQEIEDKKGVQ